LKINSTREIFCDETYLLSDESFKGSCCLTLLEGTFGEFVELTELTGDGFVAENMKMLV
jgi:hypothetical protein